MPNVPKRMAIEKLGRLSSEGGSLVSTDRESARFKKWSNDCDAAVRNIFGEESPQVKSFDAISFTPSVLSMSRDNTEAYISSYRGGLTSAIQMLESFEDEVRDFWPDSSEAESDSTRSTAGSYDMAQICLNGHVANHSTQRHPSANKPYCDRCGAKTITACCGCEAPIRGGYYEGASTAASNYAAPAFCSSCGRAFDWTQRAVQAAIELATESGELNEQEQQQFAASVNEISRDTPKAKLAGSRIARLLGKMGPVTGNAIRDILINIASDAAIKMIWPGK